jgi:hypothetical protein
MNTIKKTTLIAVITAMAAIAVPSMASAAVWAPLNTNKTLTNTFPVVYDNPYLTTTCANSILGVHVRVPPSSTLDITSASFTSCTVSVQGSPCGSATVTATGLPWAATTSGSNVTFTEHLTVVAAQCYYRPYTFNIDGPVTGFFDNATHGLHVQPTSPMALSQSGTSWGPISTFNWHQWHETTNTLTLT